MKITFLTLLLTSIPAFAAAPTPFSAVSSRNPPLAKHTAPKAGGDAGPAGPSEPSRYDQLEALFTAGSLPSANGLWGADGWYTGRCYASDEKNEPAASLLVLRDSVVLPASDDSNGPLFSKPLSDYKPVRNFQLIHKPASEPFEFDSLTADLTVEIDKTLAELRSSSWFVPAAVGHAYVSQMGPVTVTITENRNYLFGRLDVGDGSSPQLCYYFAKVR